MHRSGTSALSGALESLGLTVGKNVMPPHPNNPKGYYENLPLTQLHDRFLTAVKSSWRDPKPVNQKWFKYLRARGWFRRELLQLLIEEFGSQRALIKDPRMCRLLPLWLPLLKRHFPQARFILTLRHPVEVAHSLHHRDQLTMDQGIKLWTVHVLEAEKSTRDLFRLFTTYDELMKAPVKTILELAKNVGLPIEDVASVVSKQIDAKLRNNTDRSWPIDAADEELTQSIYQALASGEMASSNELDRLRREYYRRLARRLKADRQNAK
jgi:hypothetical protein